MNSYETLKKKLNEEARKTNERLAIIEKFKEPLSQLDSETVGFFGNQLDLDHLSHDKIVRVIRAFGGKWDKTLSFESGHIDYQTTVDGLTIRCWAGEPPPNCKLIDVIETIPATPERTVTRKKLVCV